MHFAKYVLSKNDHYLPEQIERKRDNLVVLGIWMTEVCVHFTLSQDQPKQIVIKHKHSCGLMKSATESDS